MQTSEVIDKSDIKEPALLILKNKFIRNGDFSAIFNADKAGIISFAFKYMNRDNYYLFEIGGFKEAQKFYRLRKKINGMMKQIMKINKIDELPKSAFNKKAKIFGYEKDTFYLVRIMILEKNIKVFYSKLGKKENLIFDVNDSDIPYGNIGLGTFLTTAVFDNITLRPSIAPKSNI